MFQSFGAPAAAWQNFYLLVGTAAATLVGLMFVAITFGSSLVSGEASLNVRSFLDPIFNHFVLVLLAACLLLIPTLSATLLGVILLLLGAFRLVFLFRIFKHMRQAHAANGDLELSDWLTGIVVPVGCYLLLGATGMAFIQQQLVAFNLLAITLLAVLFLGILGAWELVVWLALVRSRTK